MRYVTHMIATRPVQTSFSHPLVVDTVGVQHLPGVAGRIGMSIAPGKKDLNGYTGAHDRDLTADLDALYAQFPATVFVSLMEDFEYRKFGIATLFPEVRQRGSQLLHYPLVDVSVPTNKPSYRVLIEQLHTQIHAGEHILVHCKGGLGRTGLVVASLLVRLGHKSTEAVRITRETRPGTIQTAAQERWVHAYARGLAL
jgi:ADP-ribosyl-[dinitrogen reductase] hydrolase